MAALVGGLCMEGLWRGWRFAMIGMKKLQDISDVACILSSNGKVNAGVSGQTFVYLLNIALYLYEYVTT